MDRPQGLPDGQCELARRELTLRTGAEDPQNADLRPRAQDILEHRRHIALHLFRYFDYMYDLSNSAKEPDGHAGWCITLSPDATASDPKHETNQCDYDRGRDQDAQGQVRDET